MIDEIEKSLVKINWEWKSAFSKLEINIIINALGYTAINIGYKSEKY